jgi:hypothetical protein
VQVYCDEGLAIRISPKPCMATREGRDEASVGKTRKPAIVPRKCELDRDADSEAGLEGNMTRCVIASTELIPRGLRPWRARKSLVWEPGEVTIDQRCWPASGRR